MDFATGLTIVFIATGALFGVGFLDDNRLLGLFLGGLLGFVAGVMITNFMYEPDPWPVFFYYNFVWGLLGGMADWVGETLQGIIR